MDDLHGKIMNIPCDESRMDMNSKTEILAYKMGHRDARHAAAELAALSQPAAQVDSTNSAMLEALKTTAGNIRSLGPAGALLEPYKIWLGVVENAIAQVDSSHPAGGECGGAHLRKALSFYADPERYHGPNQRVVRDHDPFTPEDAVYIQDVTRDRGDIAREALAKATP